MGVGQSTGEADRRGRSGERRTATYARASLLRVQAEVGSARSREVLSALSTSACTRSRWNRRAQRAASGTLLLHYACGASVHSTGKGAVEVKGRADEREMRERLREVAQGLAAWPSLLGV